MNRLLSAVSSVFFFWLFFLITSYDGILLAWLHVNKTATVSLPRSAEGVVPALLPQSAFFPLAP